MCGMRNSSVVPGIRYVIIGDAEVVVTNISISSKNRMTISTLIMKFNLYSFVIAWIQVAHAKIAPSISDECAGKWWGFRNQTSISILRMKNDAENILKSRVPLVPSLYCLWNDSTNMCSACHLRNPQHETHFLNMQSCGVQNKKNCWRNYEYYQHTNSYSWKNAMHLWIAFYCWVVIQKTLV